MRVFWEIYKYHKLYSISNCKDYNFDIIVRWLIHMYDKYLLQLKTKQIKVTPQRLEILKFLDDHRNHPTVDEIYTSLKRNNPALSKTTVYNSVDILEHNGIIQLIHTVGSEQRYDYRNDMHHHFLCRRCGDIIDIDILCPNIGMTLVEGHKVETVEGYFKGICKKCLKSEES